MIKLPIGLVMRIAELLGDIAKRKPGFEIYDKSVVLVKELIEEIERQERLLESERI